jgi:hypothetical protein
MHDLCRLSFGNGSIQLHIVRAGPTRGPGVETRESGGERWRPAKAPAMSGDRHYGKYSTADRAPAGGAAAAAPEWGVLAGPSAPTSTSMRWALATL